MDNTQDETLSATLRSDDPAPALTLRDMRVEPTLVPEFAGYATETLIVAELHGKLCHSRASLSVDLEELIELVQKLEALSTLRNTSFDWQISYGRLSLHLTLEPQAVGSNITCDIWLRDAITVREEHHCILQTNLPWIDGFLREVRRIVLQYARGREALGQG